MKLECIDCRQHPLPSQIGLDTISVKYSPSSHVTTIVMDSDVVTLGIAAKVLNQKYQDYLNTLDPATAKRVDDTTTEAVHGKD